MSKCECACSCVCPSSCKHALEDYYWREYKGIIPEDAFLAGRDIYIGQVYLHNTGLFVGPIPKGATEIEVSAYGVKKQDYLIKILCSKHKRHFRWVRTTADTYHEDTKDKHVVVGGYDHVKNSGVLTIGRVVEEGILFLGCVSSFRKKDAPLWYIKNNDNEKATTFEVLIYENSHHC